MLVDPNDPSLGRDRVHDPDAVLVKQHVELFAERAEPPRLHLDQLSVSTDEVNHEPSHRHLKAVARFGEQRLNRRVKRALTQHPDVWNQRSYEMPARPRALKRVFSDARVRLPGASASATCMAE